MPTPRLRIVAACVDQAVTSAIGVLQRLDCVDNARAQERVLRDECAELASLGSGRYLGQVPSEVSFTQMLKLANELAVATGRRKLRRNDYWTPGASPESCTAQELDDTGNEELDSGLHVRLVLDDPFQNPGANPLAHFTANHFDGVGAGARRGEPTQLGRFTQAADLFSLIHPAYGMRLFHHRDYLTLYLMDLVSQVQRGHEVLSTGVLRIPILGRRTIDRVSGVGWVGTLAGGQACFSMHPGWPTGRIGIGIVVGKRRDEE